MPDAAPMQRLKRPIVIINAVTLWRREPFSGICRGSHHVDQGVSTKRSLEDPTPVEAGGVLFIVRRSTAAGQPLTTPT